MEIVKSLFFGAAIAVVGIAQASAMPKLETAPPSISASVLDIAACGPGTHLGPYGHYCWPNQYYYYYQTHHVCPPGYHLGEHRERCWPNH
jgi:hypothetical protein